MKTIDELHKNLNNTEKATWILREFAFKWWVFGVACGVVFEFLVRVVTL